MTYLVDGRYIQDHFPGIGRYVYNLVDALARVAPEEQFRVPWSAQPGSTRLDVARLARHPNVELVEVNAPPFSPAAQLLGLDRRLTGGTAAWHSAYYVMPYHLPLPTLVTLEDVTPLVLYEEMPHALKRLAYRALNRLAASRAAQLLTLSEAARNDIVRTLGIPSERLTVVPLAADPSFQPLDREALTRVRAPLGLERYALYVGSNKPHKNLTRLVNAWACVPGDLPLILAGQWDARYPEPLQAAERLGLGERVRFLHNVPESQLPGLIGAAELFVFPSLHEGFGLPPLEAIASGVPVACSRASALPEVVGDGALLFDPLNEEEMTAALTRLTEEAALRDELRERGRAQAARFSWERTARETLQVYRSVSRRVA